MMKEVTFEDGPMGMGLDPIEEGQDGAIVKMVSEGSQAEKIGVQEGDLVKFIAGENVTETNIESMMKMLQESPRPLKIVFATKQLDTDNDIFFKAGDLGFLYGVLSQAQASGSVTNVATLNFPVHGFQESFAYLFFSPLLGEFGKGKKSDLYALYAFALNMLVRRYASRKRGKQHEQQR